MSDNAILTLALRPKTLDEMTGMTKMVAAIRTQVKTRNPQAWLLAGPSGSGKTTLARIMALAYQCTHQAIWGNPCEACQAKQSEFNISEINAAEVNGVEEVTAIAQSSRLLPYKPSAYRVYILDEAHMLTSASQNMLLKYFEDAPKTTIWIIGTTDPRKIIKTLQRRCFDLTIKSLTTEALENLVTKTAKVAGITKPTGPLIEALMEGQVFTPAGAIMALEKYGSGATAKDSVSGDTVSVNSFRICKTVAAGEWMDLRKELQGMTPEDSRLVRASVAAYLKGWLLKEGVPGKRQALSASILALLGPAPLDDATLGTWLVAQLYECCRRIKMAK